MERTVGCERSRDHGGMTGGRRVSETHRDVSHGKQNDSGNIFSHVVPGSVCGQRSRVKNHHVSWTQGKKFLVSRTALISLSG